MAASCVPWAAVEAVTNAATTSGARPGGHRMPMSFEVPTSFVPVFSPMRQQRRDARAEPGGTRTARHQPIGQVRAGLRSQHIAED